VCPIIYWYIPNITPTCFSNSLPPSGFVLPRSYSGNICVVDVYGLQLVQCGQLSTDATLLVTSLYNWPHWTNCNPHTSTTQILPE
jgi:hypothetical protein